ncbi:hypothetical protein CSQ89_09050 [Chitinimonas sp. BJB300]|nr:hypothetical protein CSQ89_09050 [Chitinimonas sp. BJB300]
MIDFVFRHVWGRLGKTVYVRIDKTQLHLQEVETGKCLEVKLSDEGASAFGHPRTMLANFTHAQRVLSESLAQLGRPFLGYTSVLMHPLDRLEGDITQIEARALKELGYCVGARRCVVWVGRVLTQQELGRWQLPTTGGQVCD